MNPNNQLLTYIQNIANPLTDRGVAIVRNYRIYRKGAPSTKPKTSIRCHAGDYLDHINGNRICTKTISDVFVGGDV